EVLKNYKIKRPVFAGEINIEKLIEKTNLKKEYKRLPKFPAIIRDISLIVDEDIYVSEVDEVIKTTGKKIIKENKLVDVFRDDKIGEGKKSLSFRQSYRAKDRTLTDEEADKIQDKFIKILSKEKGAVLRDK
ncbi:MAG: phenylalanine--tRNA ligase subunit beta, partial [Clostridiales Family XIII bacterium]|nr:phenylalanine--tRNA ligase subunit beta [Clostridiales Family XIII bacterium]